MMNSRLSESQTISSLSHHIRSPINVVLNLASVLLETELEPEQRNYIEMIRSSGHRLLGLVNNLFDYLKIESGQLALNEVPFDLRGCIEEAFDLLSAESGQKNIDLLYFFENNVPALVLGDANRIRQLIQIVVQYLIQQIEEDEIIISCRQDPFSAELTRLSFSVASVKNNFIPRFQTALPQEHQKEFELELSICAHLTQIMGGDLSFRSLPNGNTAIDLNVIVSAMIDEDDSTRVVPQLLQGSSVLIVDSSDNYCNIVAKLVVEWGLNATIAKSSDEATELLKNQRFAFAIISATLLDGVPLAEQIHLHHRETASVVVIPSNWSGALSIRCYALISKPIKSSQLFDLFIQYVVDFPKHPQQRQAILTKASSPLRILIVEDHIVNQKVLQNLLFHLGYNADIANNGFDALQAVAQVVYDLILMDIEMPGMNGFELARRIRAMKDGQHPILVAVTAHDGEQEKGKYRQVGMNDSITKPIDVKQLERVLALTPTPQTHSLDVLAKYADLTMLESQFGDEAESLFSELLPLFIADTAPMLQELRLAIDSADYEGMSTWAHGIKGAAATLGLRQIMEDSHTIELLGRQRQTVGASELADRIMTIFEKIAE